MAVLGVCLAVRAVIVRTVRDARARLAALALALLFAGWGALVARWLGDGNIR